MKQPLALLAVALLAGGTQAADIGVSVQVGQPGFYGRIDFGNAPPPPVVVAEPVWVQPVAVRPQPVYMRVPPGHQKHWEKHCHEYHACGVPVYFVREDWYQEHYSRKDGEGDHAHGKGRGKDKHKDKDKGHD